MLKKIDKAIDALYKAIVVLTLLGIVVAVTLQIAARYMLSSPLIWTDEYSRMFFCWSVMLGAAVACREDSHLEVDVIYAKMGPVGKRIMDVVNHLLIFITSAVLFAASIQKALGEQNKASLATRTPSWIPTLAVILGSVAMAAYSLLWTIRYAKGEVKKNA